MQNLKVLGLLAGLAWLSAQSEARGSQAKKLIEFGWDEPGTEFLRSHIDEMQRTPFDGCVFHADYHKPDGESGSFTWKAWGTQSFREGDLQAAFADLRATRFGRFNENFLRFNTTPGKLDWFDDYGAVVTNAMLAARLARAGRCPGVLLDDEQYEGQLFNYRQQRDAKTKSWELYAAKARSRGNQVMRAFQKGYPNLTIFLTFGYSLPWGESNGGQRALADCSYGLLAPFLDGMIEAAEGRTRIVDGHELSYGYKETKKFARASRLMKQDLFPIVRDSHKYQRVISVSFGLWLDYDWRKQAWNTEDFSKNYFSPEEFETSVRQALRVADKYVWIYSETPRWWSDIGTPVKVPAAYDAAVRRARGQ